MLRFHKVENFLFLFISVHLGLLLLQLAFVASVLASVLVIVFSINQDGVYFIHTHQFFNKNCSTFINGLRHLGK